MIGNDAPSRAINIRGFSKKCFTKNLQPSKIATLSLIAPTVETKPIKQRETLHKKRFRISTTFLQMVLFTDF